MYTNGSGVHDSRLAGVKGTSARVHMFRLHERDVVSPVGKRGISECGEHGEKEFCCLLIYEFSLIQSKFPRLL